MKLALIDNYDSFTYNLAHLALELGAGVTVMRNDCFDVAELAAYDGIILSPGPGIPAEAGELLNVIRRYAGEKPMLGVCLGHQAIAEALGGKLVNLDDVFHGVQTPVRLVTGAGGVPVDELFAGLPSEIAVGRYHSWVVDAATLPACLEVTATSAEGQVMALRHRQHNLHGIQFHPESVLTPEGRTILANWLATIR